MGADKMKVMTSHSTWHVIRVTSPHELLGARTLFDGRMTLETAADSISRSGQHFVLAISRNQEPIGFASGVEMRHPDKLPELFINELGVMQAWRQRGVARSLLEALSNIARESGVATIWTATERDNGPALATYRSWGANFDETTVMVNRDITGARRSNMTGNGREYNPAVGTDVW